MKKGFLSSKPKTNKKSNKTKQKQSSTNIVENAIQSITTKNKQQKQAWLFLLQRTDDIIEAKELIHKNIINLLIQHIQQPQEENNNNTLISLQIFNNLTKHDILINQLNFIPFINKAKAILEQESMKTISNQESIETKDETTNDNNDKLIIISIRIIINTIKCNNTNDNNNINQLLYDNNDNSNNATTPKQQQNKFIATLISLSNHTNLTIKSAIHATLNILFSTIPNENESEQFLKIIMESLIQTTKKQLNVNKQLNLVATLSSLSHNSIVSDILQDYKEDGIKILSQLAMSSGPKTQEYIINICSNISSHEKGRLLITTTEHCLNALQYLMLHSTSKTIKSLATLTVTKLESMRKKGGFDSSTDNGILVLEQVCLNIKSNDDIMINKGIESLGKFSIHIYNIYINL